MALKWFVLAALLGTAVSLTCYEYDCSSDLDSNICAMKSDSNTVEVNDDGCDCDVSYATIVLVAMSDVGDGIDCTDSDYSFSYSADDTDYDSYNCGTRDTDTNLSGVDSYPHECDDDSDCLREDGEYDDCMCGFDGNSYCVVDMDSEQYDDLWDACDDEDGDEIAYWIAYDSMFPYTEDTPSCIEDITIEFQMLSDLDDERDSAAALVFSLFGAFAVLY
eukprot:CAMPEP_0204905124 /NCGR_PEP_ID=MMETSP1397-20131031/5237_1 /ASSEMBLY_ACC=CAM_ASM_000891 /TAXON_ID=49980 /ORGANISM="Climacostomum Climacostomum virens, Strain Stock W-24" /LENGTH=218 /DNA_ID=CAMNT_0052073985 /DNA_START=1425 /DNA_END=2081 /DNA_ORIENTATION=+